MASSSSPPPPPPPQQQTPLEPPLGVPLLLPAPPPPSSRRLPPPCWTPDETAALIDAYRQKWYSLRRGNLRAAHWQEVADDVHRFCPNVSPPKTAVQCRHKMEKLRKRYRAELQRAKSIPHHRFSSSWVYFPKMDSMEKGDSVFPGGSGNNFNKNIQSSVNPVVAVADEFLNDGFDDTIDDDDDNNNDNDDDEDYNGGSFRKEFKDFQRNGLRIRIAGNSMKKYGEIDEIPNPNPNSRFGYKSSSLNYNEFGNSPQFDGGVRYATRVVKNGNYNNGGGSGNGGGSSSSGMGLGMTKKKRSALGKRERERGDGVTMEMVEAIRVLGEGFLNVEKMKMDMVRESERLRMENEMKRTQMILETQRQLVESFAKGWTDLTANNDNDEDDDD